MKIGLMTPGLSNYDAISNDVAGMYAVLRAMGLDTYIFTRTGDTDTGLAVLHYRDAALLLRNPDDVIIYHYGVYDHEGLQVLRRLQCRTLIRYHNVTPPSLMGNYSLDHTRACALGRKALAELVDLNVSGFIADSQFNQLDLLNFGIDRAECRVVPPFHQVDALIIAPDSPSVRQVLERSAINILSIGRIVPSKGYELMLDAFAVALKAAPVRMRLHLVGGHDPRLSNYIDMLRGKVEELELQHDVLFHPKIDDSGLATFYRGCDLFWTMSQHEGFCVPLVEAMAMGLPIVALPSGAIPETLGDLARFSTISVRTAPNAIERLMRDESLRFGISKRGRDEFRARFSLSVIAREFVAAIGHLLGLDENLKPGSNETEESCSKFSSLELAGIKEAAWFGMPNAESIVARALQLSGAPRKRVRWSVDAQRDLLEWLFREGVKKDSECAEFAKSPALHTFMRDIPVPSDGIVLSGPQRLTWLVSRQARSAFDLESRFSIVAFLNWYDRIGYQLYRF